MLKYVHTQNKNPQFTFMQASIQAIILCLYRNKVPHCLNTLSRNKDTANKVFSCQHRQAAGCSIPEPLYHIHTSHDTQLVPQQSAVCLCISQYISHIHIQRTCVFVFTGRAPLKGTLAAAMLLTNTYHRHEFDVHT